MGILYNAIVVSWSQVIPGREALAAELFANRIGYFEKCQKAGRLESWEPVLMSPHGGAPLGFFILRGTHENPLWVWDDEEFQQLNLRAMQCVADYSVLPAFRGTEAYEVLGMWAKLSPR